MKNGAMADELYISETLLEVLLDQARRADPDPVSIQLAAEPVEAIDDGLDLPPETPIFTTYYFPKAGSSVEFVFGVNLGTPPGETQGIFHTHPNGPPTVTTSDDMAERLLIAVPPWEPANVAAFDRQNRPLNITQITVPD